MQVGGPDDEDSPSMKRRANKKEIEILARSFGALESIAGVLNRNIVGASRHCRLRTTRPVPRVPRHSSLVPPAPPLLLKGGES